MKILEGAKMKTSVISLGAGAVCFLALQVFAGDSAFPSGASGSPVPPKVRVLVAEDEKFFRLSVQGAYVIQSLPSLQALKKGSGLENVPLTVTKKGLKLGDAEWPVSRLRIETKGKRDLVLNHTRFRGEVEIVRANEHSLAAVNHVDLEDYLYGVLPHEVAFWWPMEALKAQAIAARTYALYQMRVNHRNLFDLKSSTSSQVYKGTRRERHRTNRAVDETRGRVLTYEGKIFPAYFHATCAGITTGAQELWKMEISPLGGGVRCGYCRISPHYYWKAAVPLSEIEEKLKLYRVPLGRILRIEPVSQTPSGRVGSLRFVGTLREDVIAAKDFRIWVGGNRIRSTAFTVKVREDAAQIDGKGWGHGVGLCQWGALGQALAGRAHEDILRFYYPGAEIRDGS